MEMQRTRFSRSAYVMTSSASDSNSRHNVPLHAAGVPRHRDGDGTSDSVSIAVGQIGDGEIGDRRGKSRHIKSWSIIDTGKGKSRQQDRDSNRPFPNWHAPSTSTAAQRSQPPTTADSQSHSSPMSQSHSYQRLERQHPNMTIAVTSTTTTTIERQRRRRQQRTRASYVQRMAMARTPPCERKAFTRVPDMVLKSKTEFDGPVSPAS